MTLTKEEVQGIVKDILEALPKPEPIVEPVTRKFTPSAGIAADEGVVKDEADKPFANFGEQLQAVRKAGSGGAYIREPRLRRCIEGALDPITKAPTGLGETVPSDGGFLVAQEFIPTMIDRAWDTAVVYQMCAKQPVGANFNGVKIPALNETSRADGSRWGGVRGYWGAEAATITGSHEAYRQVSIELQKLFALVVVTDELLEDSVALEGYVSRHFGQEIGFKLDDAIINGDGAGKPLGILNSPARVSVSAETGQLATTIVTNNILKMYRRMWSGSMNKGSPVWLANQNILTDLFTLNIPIGTAGALANLYQMPIGNSPTAGSAYGTILGRPLYVIEQAQSLGTEGDLMFFDPQQYLVIEKGGLAAASSIHLYFLTDQTAFRFVFRCNGEPLWHSTLTPFKGSDTISPYVTLATRS